MSIPPRTLPIIAVLAIALATPATAQAQALTDEQQIFYYLGMVSARNLMPFDLSPEEIALVQRGMAETLGGKPFELDPRAVGANTQTLLQDRMKRASADEQRASDAFVEQEAAKEGARRTDSGMVFQETQAGTGEQPSATDTVVVHYHGTLRDGSVFDSSKERGQPFRSSLDRVIGCWTEGVAKMRVGGKARLVCPPHLAYGDNGQPPKIPGGAALIFDVELLEIVKE